jgi:hypothetical protein
MWTVVRDVIVLGAGAAAFLDLAVGFASGLLQLALADRTLAPNLFWRCVVCEVVTTLAAVAWFCFPTAL